MTEYESLANAIVLMAFEDYRDKLRGKAKKDMTDSKAYLERFFKSKWFVLLTSVNGPFLLKQLKEEYKSEKKGGQKNGAHKKSYRSI